MNKTPGKVLVTGADGFIGSHLVETLIKDGRDVRAFVFYNSFNSWGWLDHISEENKKNLDVVAGDIRDPFGVRNAMEGCDTVINLAALISIPFSYRSPDSFIDTNIKGALNVLQAARELGVKKVIQTSTSEVYGTAQFVPITEEHPLQGQSAYSASKIGADQIAMSFFSSFDTPVVILRPFNTYGPRQSARAVIPTIITQIANGFKEIKLGDITPTRDFNYVEDTCRALIALAESDETIGQTINIGSNFEISIADTLNIIKELMDSNVEFIADEQRIRPKKSEVFRLWCDNTKIEQLTGFKPQVDINEGLQRTVDWFTDSKRLERYKAGIYNV